jgi:DNA-binding MarR family transcriptional regulator
VRPGSPGERHPSLDAKIVGALDRISDTLQVLARRAASSRDLSPTQMRVLARLQAGPPPVALTSELAREFDVADPTVSDAVAALRRKGLIEHSPDPADRRRHRLRLTAAGRALGRAVPRWTAPAEVASSGIARPQAEALLGTLLDLLDRMHSAGLLTVVRACTTCQHFQRGPAGSRPVLNHCRHFGYTLGPSDLRVDCAEHAARESQASAARSASIMRPLG